MFLSTALVSALIFFTLSWRSSATRTISGRTKKLSCETSTWIFLVWSKRPYSPFVNPSASSFWLRRIQCKSNSASFACSWAAISVMMTTRGNFEDINRDKADAISETKEANSSMAAVLLKGSPRPNAHGAFPRSRVVANRLAFVAVVPPRHSHPPIATDCPSAFASALNHGPWDGLRGFTSIHLLSVLSSDATYRNKNATDHERDTFPKRSIDATHAYKGDRKGFRYSNAPAVKPMRPSTPLKSAISTEPFSSVCSTQPWNPSALDLETPAGTGRNQSSTQSRCMRNHL